MNHLTSPKSLECLIPNSYSYPHEGLNTEEPWHPQISVLLCPSWGMYLSSFFSTNYLKNGRTRNVSSLSGPSLPRKTDTELPTKNDGCDFFCLPRFRQVKPEIPPFVIIGDKEKEPQTKPEEKFLARAVGSQDVLIVYTWKVTCPELPTFTPGVQLQSCSFSCSQ